MGLFVKKDEKESIKDGIEVIERRESPEGDPAEGDQGTDKDFEADVAAQAAENAKIVRDEIENDDEDDEEEPAAGGSDDGGSDDGDDDDGGDGDDPDGDTVDEASDFGGGSGKGGHGGPRVPVAGLVAGVVIAAVVCGIGGYFIGNGGFGTQGPGTAKLEESQLDGAVASYTYDGKSVTVSAKQAIESQYSLDKVKDSDNKYATPSADNILAYVRNQILLKECQARNITVSDDEVKTYAESQLGSSDFKTLASQYGVSEDQAKGIVKDSATIQKLYNQIVPDATSAPQQPTAPADGNNQTASKEYADYIIKLAGDEWDASKGTWKSADGQYAKAFQGQTVKADSATYEQAQTAYYVAYQAYQSKASEYQSKWKDFANGLYAKAQIKIYGLYA